MKNIKTLLDKEVLLRNCVGELSEEKPDPLMVALGYRDERIALICALFAYGNAKLIVKFLQSLDFSLLDASEETIRESLSSHYYRFQKSEDVIALFIALKRLKQIDSIENLFYKGYAKEHNILDGLWHFISVLKEVYPQDSRGYAFWWGLCQRR